MGRRYDTVSFLSDFGLVDESVGVVKAVMRDMAPHALVIDLGHQVQAYDVRGGSLMLARCVSYLPSGVVMAVVDPGVGAARRAVAIEVADGDGVMIGPDNGLLAPAVAMAGGAGRAVLLDNPEFHLLSPGGMFAARDIFAPVAAHLCNGVDLHDLGARIDPDELLPGVVPLPRDDDGSVYGEVLWIDHYGNCQLNMGPDDVAGWDTLVQVTAGDTVRVATLIGAAAGLDAVGPGAVALVVDAYGMLTLCLDHRSASSELALAPGDQVSIAPLAPEHASTVAPLVVTPVTLRPSR